MDNWISVDAELPPLDLPVWLYFQDLHQPIIGCRSDDDDGWLWGRCYDDYWYDQDKGTWCTTTCDTDDCHPSHWRRLPEPPSNTDYQA